MLLKSRINCLASEYICMILQKLRVINGSFWFTSPRKRQNSRNSFLISLTIAMFNQHDPIKRQMTCADIKSAVNPAKHCINSAIKYPNGAFQLNGMLPNASCKRQFQFFWLIKLKQNGRGTKGFDYLHHCFTRQIEWFLVQMQNEIIAKRYEYSGHCKSGQW